MPSLAHTNSAGRGHATILPRMPLCPWEVTGDQPLSEPLTFTSPEDNWKRDITKASIRSNLYEKVANIVCRSGIGSASYQELTGAEGLHPLDRFMQSLAIAVSFPMTPAQTYSRCAPIARGPSSPIASDSHTTSTITCLVFSRTQPPSHTRVYEASFTHCHSNRVGFYAALSTPLFLMFPRYSPGQHRRRQV